MNRRRFLTGAAIGMTGLGFPAIARAQVEESVRIGFPLPLTGPFGAIAADQQRGAILAMEQINARGGMLGRKVEILFRDDQLKPAIGAQRTMELIENDKVDFIVGGLAAHVQMAINEQAKKAGKLYISISQSDEISARPDSGPLTFHEALNPTITARTVGHWAMTNLGKRVWVIYADYAWGKQTYAAFADVVKKAGGTVLGATPYPIGTPEFSVHLPRLQAAKPEVVLAVTPGSDGVAFAKQARSFGLSDQARMLVPVHVLFTAKEGGAEAFANYYGGSNFYWEIRDTVPEAKKFAEAFMKRFKIPPDSLAGHAYSGIMEVARGVELAKSLNSDAVASALLAHPHYDHYKGKQWWRKCDRKSFQDTWIVKARPEPRGEWGLFDVIARTSADETLDRTCAEKGWA